MRPVALEIRANSAKESPLPMVAWITPRPASPSAPAMASISSTLAARLGTGRPS